MSNTLGFGRDDLRRLAGARSFERGIGYLSCVSALEIGERTITATVDGTDVYEVELTEHEDGLTGCCDCPYGQEVTSASTAWQWAWPSCSNRSRYRSTVLPPHPAAGS
ncbi:hypothetical protein ABTY59_11330 [Streptomyces sp. NPDC096079]|uniref:SWIM zinc finger family protein n=1 Tax=Streptomyces sp. NPDC096079 TaxID=3155820 RepID=UPI00332E1159